jgi:serine/threonine protein kinase
VDSFDSETSAGVSFFLVQELAQGASLWELLQEGARFGEVELKELAREVLPILTYLHEAERPLIHRDVKPSNIVQSAHGRVALVDFGAAQEWGQDDPPSSSDGTRGYMAPEQLRGHAAPASDLYGLGATLIFLLTRVEPAQLPTPGGKLEFRVVAPVSPEFGSWLDSLVEPELSRRVPTAAAALARLDQLEARVSRRRHRTARALALAALTAAGIAMLYGAPEFAGSPARAAEPGLSDQ